MNAPQFQLNKVKRLIMDYGEEFNFERPSLNEFDEPVGIGSTIQVTGVYHEALGYVYLSESTSDATTKRQKIFPMVLMTWEDANRLLHTDTLTYKGRAYRVGEINNIGEAFVAADVSLTEVQV